MQKALCDYAIKLTLNPGDVSDGDLEKLRHAGCDDKQITIATQVISFFNLINRIADGLGVDAEDWMELSPDQWRQQKADFKTGG